MTNELALYNPSNESVVVYRTEDNTLQLDVQVKGDSVVDPTPNSRVIWSKATSDI